MRSESLDTEMAAKADAELKGYLREYYGRRLKKTDDLSTNACCADSTAARFPDIMKLIPAEVKDRNYGCGCSIPDDDLDGLTVLDLGSGAGLDAFIVSRLVGPRGRVIGIDMTDEQLDIARRNNAPVTAAFGFERPNVEFHKGFIETLEMVESDSVDLVISDCVVNLSPRKDRVLAAIWRVLKDGGEFYISDIVADRRVPTRLREDALLVAECLGGALYENDLRDIVENAGFLDPRQVSRSLVEQDVAGEPIRFYSITFRGFKFEQALDRRCEDYGQIATYRGNCRGSEARFRLDDHHEFERDRPIAVCRNTARFVSDTRLSRYFEVTAQRQHFGLFPCGPQPGNGDAPSEPCC